jgi:hypothetical protein
MKPYAFDPNAFNDTGCCPGHDWPCCYRWAGRYSSNGSRRKARHSNKAAKRIRRHRDRAALDREGRDLDFDSSWTTRRVTK